MTETYERISPLFDRNQMILFLKHTLESWPETLELKHQSSINGWKWSQYYCGRIVYVNNDHPAITCESVFN